MTERSNVVSSFTIIKGSLIDETYAVFRAWDFSLSKKENLDRVRNGEILTGGSSHWVRDVAKVLNRRFDPVERDRALVELAIAHCELEVWKPLLLFHMTRDEFLVRDFLVSWLYERFSEGAYRLYSSDVLVYLDTLKKKKAVEWSGHWSAPTVSRVASGLLRIAADFGLLKGVQHREFASYHLPETSFIYLLHVISAAEPNARRMIEAADWRMFLLDADDVERELLRLHQFRKLHFEAAGSLAQLKLPHNSSNEYARELTL